MPERALEKDTFVCNATLQFPSMDVVKWLLVQPLVFKVVHFKNTIGRNPKQGLLVTE